MANPTTKFPEKILLVDDEQEILSLLENRLKESNYSNVSLASNGKQALELMESHNFDLMITDIKMPKMMGQELIVKVRQSENLKNMPIIVLSAFVKRESTLEISNLHYLPKPFSSKKLLKLIEAILSTGKVSQRQNFISKFVGKFKKK